MPANVTVYKVFIASPGGLSEERTAFRNLIESYNRSEALPRGIMFQAVGWEDTLATSGRPQALINEDLRQCDYFVMMLWDRWGSKPATSGKYTSGTEEEFHVACQCKSGPSAPMGDMVLLFKDCDPKQLADPGEQLKQVLAFKVRIEVEKQFLFSVFRQTREFEESLRAQFAKWVRDHEKNILPSTREIVELAKPQVSVAPLTPETIPAQHEAAPKSAFWNQRGVDSYVLGDFESSLVFFREAAKSREATEAEGARALLNSGIALGALNRSEEALAVYDEVERRFGNAAELALREQVARALVNRGVTVRGLGRTEEATTILQNLLAAYRPEESPMIATIIERGANLLREWSQESKNQIRGKAKSPKRRRAK